MRYINLLFLYDINKRNMPQNIATTSLTGGTEVSTILLFSRSFTTHTHKRAKINLEMFIYKHYL
jgi:hypothetical protein